MKERNKMEEIKLIMVIIIFGLGVVLGIYIASQTNNKL